MFILGDRLTVGQRPLKPLIGVRFPISQPNMANEYIVITQISQINNSLKTLVQSGDHVYFIKDILLPLIISFFTFSLSLLFGFLVLKRRPNFKVFHVQKNIDITSQEFSKEVVINLNGAISTDFEFSIKPELKFPLFYSSKNSKCRIQLVDKENLLMFPLLDKLPGLPLRYKIDPFEIEEPNIIKHFSFLISPEKTFEKYTLYLWIYFRGKKFEEKLIVSIYK